MFRNAHSIKTPFLVTVAIAAIVTTVAFATALLSLQRVTDRFGAFIDHDQALLSAFTDMYANGLQTGQALRNIILDPQNPQAYKNLDAANKKFDDAFDKAARLSADNAATASVVTDVGTKWKTNQATRARIVEAAKTDRDEAIRILNKDETPAWRQVRELLLKQIDDNAKAVDATRKAVQDQAHSAILLTLAFALAAGAVVALTTMLVLSHIVGSLRTLDRSMSQLASGNGNLTQRLEVRSQDEVGRIAASFNQFMTELQGTIGSIRDLTEQVGSSADCVTSQIDRIAVSVGEQSNSAASIATEVEALSTSIATVADSAGEVRHESDASLAHSREGSQSVERLVGEISRIDNTVQAITASVGDYVAKVRTINNLTSQVKDIADQTNLLALNAAIEAARAGEQGRGFAVVADEVRKLAEKSASTANEIDAVTQALGQQSSGLEATVQESVSAIQTSREVLDNVSRTFEAGSRIIDNAHQGIDNITDSVRAQKTASEGIAGNIERIARGAEENTTVAAQARSAVHDLDRIAGSLRQAVGHFRVS